MLFFNYLDSSTNWLVYFQDAASPVMEGIIDLYYGLISYVVFFIIFILFYVLVVLVRMVLVRMLYSFNSNSIQIKIKETKIVVFPKCTSFEVISPLLPHWTEPILVTNTPLVRPVASNNLEFKLIYSVNYFKPYLSCLQLYRLLSADLPICWQAFYRKYQKFVNRESNAELLVSDELYFPSGKHNTKILTFNGIMLFEQANKTKFKFCHFSIVNFYIAADIALKH